MIDADLVAKVDAMLERRRRIERGAYPIVAGRIDEVRTLDSPDIKDNDLTDIELTDDDNSLAAVLGLVFVALIVLVGGSALLAWPIMLILGAAFPALGLSFMGAWAVTAVAFLLGRAFDGTRR